MARLSVFRGGFQREPAEQVAGASLSMLSGLITKSLMQRSGGHRYDLHELIRQYAADRLADQPQGRKEAQERHARYYLGYITSRDTPLRSSAQRETLAELTAEMDNFRAAWDWAMAHHEFASVRRIPEMLWYLFELRTWFEEGETVFRKAAEAIQSYATEIGSRTYREAGRLKDADAVDDRLRRLLAHADSDHPLLREMGRPRRQADSR